MRNVRYKSCSLRAACRNGIPPSLPTCRVMVSSSIRVDHFPLLSQHELVPAIFLNESERIANVASTTIEPAYTWPSYLCFLPGYMPVFPILRMLPELPILKMLPTLPMLRMLPELPMLKRL